MEIRTPKIIPGESEGGAGVFTTDYFGRVRRGMMRLDGIERYGHTRWRHGGCHAYYRVSLVASLRALVERLFFRRSRSTQSARAHSSIKCHHERPMPVSRI